MIPRPDSHGGKVSTLVMMPASQGQRAVRLGASARGGLGLSVLLVGMLVSPGLSACNRNKEANGGKPAPTKHGLTEDQAQQPLIVVGDTTVTVGQFAQQLAEKSPYLRARYASPERRREL